MVPLNQLFRRTFYNVSAVATHGKHSMIKAGLANYPWVGLSDRKS